MKKSTLFILLLMLSSNISAQDTFEWNANEETRDVVYETPTSKFCKKWYYDLKGSYCQLNSNGSYLFCSGKIYRFPDKLYGVPFIVRYSGTWKRINKMEIHLQITNFTISLDEKELAKLPARRRDAAKNNAIHITAEKRKDYIGKYKWFIWRLDNDYFMYKHWSDNGDKDVMISERIYKEALKNKEEEQSRKEKEQEKEAEEKEQFNNKVYDTVEDMPQFPGGPSAMFEYLSKNIQYPEGAKKEGIQGRVIVTIIIEKDGSITDAKVVKSLAPSLDREAQRLVESMPNWIPGKQNGEPVRVKYTVPVTFRLQ